MEPRVMLVAGAVALLGAWLLARRASSSIEPVADPGAPELPPLAEDYGDTAPVWTFMHQGAEANRVETSLAEANVSAFLDMIAWAEGTAREPRPYAVTYGYRHVIQDFGDHPAITGEWRGEKLPDAMCKAAGYGPGCVSTAAGRYQLIRPTWQRARDALGLADFTPESQDAAAVWLLAQRGALPLIREGDIPAAIVKARAEWASLPGNSAGQPQRRTDDLIAAYVAAGGVLA